MVEWLTWDSFAAILKKEGRDTLPYRAINYFIAIVCINSLLQRLLYSKMLLNELVKLVRCYYWRRTMDIQRLRNLTTGILHTEIGHVYEDLETVTGTHGLMTHMLPRVLDAVEPWLKEHVTDQRFWDDKYDTKHVGEYKLPEPTDDDRKAMVERYMAMPNPLDGKDVIAVQV